MPRIAVLGGTGYLASIIKNQNNFKQNKYFFFSRRKNSKNFINYLNLENNINTLKKFDLIIHLVGPNNKQIKKKLLEEKNKITSNICNLCINHNIKLIYISSMQVYKDYGKDDISISSKINLSNLYARSHYESERIILKKFIKNKNMFIILRLGNVFGFKKYENLREINNNLIHGFCISALKKKKIIIKNGSIQRSFVPSQIFVQVLNSIIKKNLFKNSIINIFYKNFSLEDIAKVIQKRSKSIFNLTTDIVIKKFNYRKKFVIYANQHFRFNPTNKKIYFEIDQILKNIKKMIKKT